MSPGQIAVGPARTRWGRWLAYPGRPAGRPISAPRARLAAAGCSRHAARAPLARSALAAPRPGPRGPGSGSSSRADVAVSGRSGPRLALRHGSQTLTVCGSPRHVAIAPGGVRGPAGRCAAAGVVTWRPRGPAGDRIMTAGSTPAAIMVKWGTEGDAVPLARPPHESSQRWPADNGIQSYSGSTGAAE